MARVVPIRQSAGIRLQETVTLAGIPQAEVSRARSVFRSLSSEDDLDGFESIKFASRAVKSGNHLFYAGDAFSYVYSIDSGFFKTSLVDCQGREQVTGFFMSDELVGLDGLCANRYRVSAVALEDSTVWSMPYSVIAALARESPSLQRTLHSALAREIERSYDVMMLLGSMSAQERVAGFLVDLSRRHLRRQLSGSTLQLRMTRAEIGSYLGLSLETVSRTFSIFRKAGLINVQQRELSVVDVEGLDRLLFGDHPPGAGPAGLTETAGRVPAIKPVRTAADAS